MNINGKLGCLYHSYTEYFIWFALETLSYIIAPRRKGLHIIATLGQQNYYLFVLLVSFTCLVSTQSCRTRSHQTEDFS